MFPGEYFTFVRQGKGGRERVSPIIGKNMEQIVARMKETPAEEKVWQHVHKSADIHSYRAEYATAIYKAHARAIQDIPYDRVNKGTGRRYQSEVYTCRKDEAGKKLSTARNYSPTCEKWLWPGRSWTRLPCWCAARPWAITGSALWPTTTSGVCEGGM